MLDDKFGCKYFKILGKSFSLMQELTINIQFF